MKDLYVVMFVSAFLILACPTCSSNASRPTSQFGDQSIQTQFMLNLRGTDEQQARETRSGGF